MEIFAKGIDVSVNQGSIDWKKVKADKNVQFAIIKCAWGTKIADNFEINYKGAKDAGLPVGAYCYSYATTVESAKKEAEAVVKILKGKTFEYPIALDIEDKSQLKLSKKTLTEICKTFCQVLEKAGYYVCIYSYKSFLTDKLNMKELSAYDVWLSQFNNTVTYKGAYGMWQYSEKGKIKGINADALLDYAYKDYPTIIKKAGLNGFKKTTATTTSKPKEETTSKKQDKPTSTKTKKHKMCDKIKLANAPLYSSSTEKSTKNRKTGTFYIYDGEVINGRMRITRLKSACGKRPVWLNVTGWVNVKDIIS